MSTAGTDTRTSLDLDFERLTSSTTARLSLSSDTTDSAEIPHPTVITLDIAGRLFKVSTDILIAESGLFQRQLSGRYNWTPQRDGTYFLDADPELFEHLVRYMRRPSVFPLFWSKSQGFDYGLYLRLQAEAEYFQMDTLHDWIKGKKYRDAVMTMIHQPETRELKDVSSYWFEGDTCEDWHYVTKVRKTYLCPRRIHVHFGNPDACGQACRKFQGDAKTEYHVEEYLEVVSVKKEILFDDAACQMR